MDNQYFGLYSKYNTCNFMYSFSFFFVSHICGVLTCFSNVNKQLYYTIKSLSRIVIKWLPKYNNELTTKYTNLITNHNSLKLISFLLQLVNLGLKGC